MDIIYILDILYILYCQDISWLIRIIWYVRFMAAKKPKILITLSDKLVESVEDYRFENRIPSRSEAIRRLLEIALKKAENKPKK